MLITQSNIARNIKSLRIAEIELHFWTIINKVELKFTDFFLGILNQFFFRKHQNVQQKNQVVQREKTAKKFKIIRCCNKKWPVPLRTIHINGSIQPATLKSISDVIQNFEGHKLSAFFPVKTQNWRQ